MVCTDNKVSIIIPCYNQAMYLEDAIGSVLCQTHSNWECIIVNDGSLDNTEEVAKKWCEKDSRFIYVKKINGGLSSARNAGLAIAKGDFIQFLDADDIILPSKLTLQIGLLTPSKKYDISVCDYYPSEEFDLKKRYSKGRYLTPFPSSEDNLKHLIIDWEEKLSIPCHCFLFCSAFFKVKGIRFDENLPNHEDWDCWMRIFSLEPRVIFSKEILAVYRIRESAMCSDIKSMKLGYLKAINKQKVNFKHNKTLYKLLEQKEDKVMYGISFSNSISGNLYFIKRNYRAFRHKFNKGLKKLMAN